MASGVRARTQPCCLATGTGARLTRLQMHSTQGALVERCVRYSKAARASPPAGEKHTPARPCLSPLCVRRAASVLTVQDAKARTSPQVPAAGPPHVAQVLRQDGRAFPSALKESLRDYTDLSLKVHRSRIPCKRENHSFISAWHKKPNTRLGPATPGDPPCTRVF